MAASKLTLLHHREPACLMVDKTASNSNSLNLNAESNLPTSKKPSMFILSSSFVDFWYF